MDAEKLKAKYSSRRKESMGGGGGITKAASRPFPPSREGSSEGRHSFRGETESSLSVLVFCAIKKKPNKINIT